MKKWLMKISYSGLKVLWFSAKYKASHGFTGGFSDLIYVDRFSEGGL
jgi:hypothetical protein